MAQGILILGLNGCGKTTIGRMLADELDAFRMDNEDYYFPTPGDYTNARPEEEVHRLMVEDALSHEKFVFSCVRCNLPEAITRQVALTIVLRTTPDLRAARILERQERRFGSRVLPGGDMYESQQAFHAFAAARTENVVDETLGRLHCPIVEIDAGLPAQEIVKQIILCYNQQERMG